MSSPQRVFSKDFFWLNLRELPYFRAMLRAIEAQFYQEFTLPAPMLDLGCGDGHFASLTFERKIDVGLDPWEGPIREAHRRGCYYHLTLANGSEMPFRNKYFASAISNSVLEHITSIDAVLKETARVLKPDAPFLFCVPNPGYFSELSISNLLEKIGFNHLGKIYIEWFRWMSRTHHANPPEIWKSRLEKAGFRLEKWWHYFSPQALRVLEWGHYFGTPTLIPHFLLKRWIIVPKRWNLILTEKLVRPYTTTEASENGTYTFYVAARE